MEINSKHYSPKLKKAFGFHSFNQHFKPDYNSNDGLSKSRAYNFDFSWIHQISVKRIIAGIILGSLFLYTSFQVFVEQEKTALSALILIISSTITLLGVSMTLATNALRAKESNTIDALSSFWGKSDVTLITADPQNQYSLKPAMSFREAINHFRKLQQHIETCAGDYVELYLAVLGARLAVGTTDNSSKKVNEYASHWQKTAEHYQINRETIRKGLNEAEALCQGISTGIYDENIVRNKIGADLSAMVTYLLSYIYTLREIHIYRLHSRSNFLSQLPFAERGKPYLSHNETHDLMYEYLEYYCYKWYLSDNAVGFKHFHRHVRAAYQDLAAQLQNGLSYSQLPFINLLVEYQKPFFSTLFAHLDIKPEDNNDTVPFIEEIKRLWK